MAVILSVILLDNAGAADPSPAKPGGPPKTIETLLIERRDTLRTAVHWRDAQYASGSIDLPVVIRAKQALANAELEVARTKAERLAVRQKQIDNLRELEHVVEHRVQAGIVSEVDVLEIKAERLKAEIDLLREQGREKPAAVRP